MLSYPVHAAPASSGDTVQRLYAGPNIMWDSSTRHRSTEPGSWQDGLVGPRSPSGRPYTNLPRLTRLNYPGCRSVLICVLSRGRDTWQKLSLTNLRKPWPQPGSSGSTALSATA